MQSKSDIFFLKRAEEEDGRQIFSVGGAPSIRLNRRKKEVTSVFPTGCMGTTKEKEEEARHPLPASSPSLEEEDDYRAEACSSRTVTETEDDAQAEVTSTTVEGYEWKRNPLTGVGVETENVRKHKKGPRKRINKWVW